MFKALITGALMSGIILLPLLRSDEERLEKAYLRLARRVLGRSDAGNFLPNGEYKGLAAWEILRKLKSSRLPILLRIARLRRLRKMICHGQDWLLAVLFGTGAWDNFPIQFSCSPDRLATNFLVCLGDLSDPISVFVFLDIF